MPPSPSLEASTSSNGGVQLLRHRRNSSSVSDVSLAQVDFFRRESAFVDWTQTQIDVFHKPLWEMSRDPKRCLLDADQIQLIFGRFLAQHAFLHGVIGSPPNPKEMIGQLLLRESVDVLQVFQAFVPQLRQSLAALKHQLDTNAKFRQYVCCCRRCFRRFVVPAQPPCIGSLRNALHLRRACQASSRYWSRLRCVSPPSSAYSHRRRDSRAPFSVSTHPPSASKLIA